MDLPLDAVRRDDHNGAKSLLAHLGDCLSNGGETVEHIIEPIGRRGLAFRPRPPNRQPAIPSAQISKNVGRTGHALTFIARRVLAVISVISPIFSP